jgi:hypothetical protein
MGTKERKMRKISANMMGIMIDAQIAQNRVYLKVNNPMLEPMFMKMLSSKDIRPEKKGNWILFEVVDEKMKDETTIGDYLINNLKQGGFAITNDTNVQEVPEK